MNVFTDISDINRDDNTVVTIGTFDGVHLGHISILNLVKEEAKKSGGRSFVVTFHPHPRQVVSKDYNMKLLTSPEEKTRLFKNAGIDNLLIVNFTEVFSQMTSETFIEDYICDKIGANHIIIGYDHKFGKNRGGDIEKLRSLSSRCGFKVTSVGPVEVDGEVISSSKIRRALLNGEIETANKYLGKNFSIEGKVIEGCKRGRSLGFPTANLEPVYKNKLIPERGVYLVKTSVDEKEYFAMMNIGIRPTFENRTDIVIEVFLFDFEGDLYGKNMKVEFLHRIRDEKKFSSKSELINQINLDKSKAQQLINLLVN